MQKDWPPKRRDDGGDWSEAQLIIFKLLWSMEWVDRRLILKEVGQSYYDRRIRELRESGWKIATKISGRDFFTDLSLTKKGLERNGITLQLKLGGNYMKHKTSVNFVGHQIIFK